LGVISFSHAVLVPAFGWGNEELFDISEHYGFFLTSLLLWGLIIPFSDRLKEKIYRSRTKIFIGANIFLLLGFTLLFLLPALAQALFAGVNFFIGFSAINFFALLLFLLGRKEDNFFTSSFPQVLAVLTAANLVPFFYREWNLVWWYYHFLWLASVLLLLLLLRAKKGGDITEILFSSFSIRTRLFFIIGLMLVAVAVNGLIDFRLSRNYLQAQTLENLTLLADLQEGQVLNYLDSLKDRTSNFASDGFIREGLKKILSGDRQAAVDLNRHLLENKQPLDPAIFGIHVMDLNGKVAASSQGNEVGREDMAMEEVFLQAKAARYGTTFLSDVVADVHFGQSNIAIMATAPLSDQARKENIGVIMLFFKTAELADILTGKAQTQMGALSSWTRKKTMEMYLVNQDKIMITESRFIVNAPLKQLVDTEPVRLCAKSEETSGEYLDYRQIPVFGASMCLPNGWTLLTEIDTDEVLGALGDYLQQNLLSGSATFLLIFIVVYLFFLGVISPLRELSQAAQKLGHGDFTARAKLMTRDEFGQLSGVFNRMAENIQNSSAGLQEKVKEAETSRLAVTNILGDLEVAKTNLEQAKAKDEAILSSIGDAVMACDKDGKIVLFNGVAQELTGFSLPEVVGHHYGRLLHFIREADEKPGNDFIAEAIAVGRQTKMANHTLLVRKDGHKIPVADSAAPVKNATGQIIGCVVVFRDVTHERDVDKAKTEFVSLASHQLRTPLSTISWYAEMLLAGDAGKITEDQKKYLDEIYRGNKRMVELVNALLNVSRLELGTFVVEPEPTDVIKLAQSVVGEQKPQIEANKLKLSQMYADNLPMLNADPKLLRIVFQNLLSNAVKYTPAEGSIKLSVTKAEDPADAKALAGKQLSIIVADTGYGIPKNQQDKIFSKLFRADNVREHDTEGTGLGLYMVKAIVDHSGGKIWFESQENKGSTFYVMLPLAGMKKKEGTKTLG
jgi:PAS domain S-box-containing protein